jgi:hypothetical protein
VPFACTVVANSIDEPDARQKCPAYAPHARARRPPRPGPARDSFWPCALRAMVGHTS